MIPLLQNLPNPRYPLPINSADVKIHPNHSAILWIDGANPSTCFTTGFAVLDHGCVYPTRVRGMKLHSGSCNFEEVPFKVSTTEGDDLIVGALKHRGDLTYFYSTLPSRKNRCLKKRDTRFYSFRMSILKNSSAPAGPAQRKN